MKFDYYIEVSQRDSDEVLDYLINEYDGFHMKDWDYDYSGNNLIVFTDDAEDLDYVLREFLNIVPLDLGRN
jgi:hypothetical protein